MQFSTCLQDYYLAKCLNGSSTPNGKQSESQQNSARQGSRSNEGCHGERERERHTHTHTHHRSRVNHSKFLNWEKQMTETEVCSS